MPMTFQDAVRSCFSKYITFSGRARRAEYWYFTLFGIIGSAIAGIIDSAIFGIRAPEATLVAGIFSLVMFLPSISVFVRRMHDTGRSGWWFWLFLIPLIGFLMLLYFLVQRGEPGTNAYGPDPIDGPGDLYGTSVPRVPRS